MDLGIRNKVAVVCAASQGLGKAAALQLAREGAHVVICGRDRKRLAAAAREIRTSTGRHAGSVLPFVADVSRAADIRKLVAAAVKKFGTIDILVTNSGGPPGGSFTKLSDAKWRDGIDLNLMSTIRCIRAVLPYMEEKRWGRIINITSLTVKQPVNDLIISSTVRPGIIGLSKVLANLYGKSGITINSVAPGFIMTARQEQLSNTRARQRGVSYEEYVRAVSADIPAGRYGTPQELANVIAFLASNRAGYVNGTTISVDGGLVKGLL
jgi:3-oxoacyl-[acyl-carrier protein] reductase